MRKWFKRISPDPERLLDNRWLRPFAHRLAHPDIWHFNRRAVARGVALGLFTGIVVPFGQVVLAALLAAPVRGNLLVAATATLLTNPFTSPPLWYAAYHLGSFVLDSPGVAASQAENTLLSMVAGASLPTVLGLGLFSVIFAVVGYFAVHLGWRFSIAWRWRRRRRARA